MGLEACALNYGEMLNIVGYVFLAHFGSGQDSIFKFRINTDSSWVKLLDLAKESIWDMALSLNLNQSLELGLDLVQYFYPKGFSLTVFNGSVLIFKPVHVLNRKSNRFIADDQTDKLFIHFFNNFYSLFIFTVSSNVCCLLF